MISKDLIDKFESAATHTDEIFCVFKNFLSQHQSGLLPLTYKIESNHAGAILCSIERVVKGKDIPECSKELAELNLTQIIGMSGPRETVAEAIIHAVLDMVEQNIK